MKLKTPYVPGYTGGTRLCHYVSWEFPLGLHVLSVEVRLSSIDQATTLGFSTPPLWLSRRCSTEITNVMWTLGVEQTYLHELPQRILLSLMTTTKSDPTLAVKMTSTDDMTTMTITLLGSAKFMHLLVKIYVGTA